MTRFIIAILAMVLCSTSAQSADVLSEEDNQFLADCLKSGIGRVDFNFPTPLSLCVSETKTLLVHETESWVQQLPHVAGEVSTEGTCIVFGTIPKQYFVFNSATAELQKKKKSQCQ